LGEAGQGAKGEKGMEVVVWTSSSPQKWHVRHGSVTWSPGLAVWPPTVT